MAEMISADTLVLLSDIDGLYTGDPRSDASAKFIPEIREITPEIEAMAGVAASAMSNGGMVTKLMAGRIAMAAGCRMAIADGRAVGATGIASISLAGAFCGRNRPRRPSCVRSTGGRVALSAA